MGQTDRERPGRTVLGPSFVSPACFSIKHSSPAQEGPWSQICSLSACVCSPRLHCHSASDGCSAAGLGAFRPQDWQRGGRRARGALRAQPRAMLVAGWCSPAVDITCPRMLPGGWLCCVLANEPGPNCHSRKGLPIASHHARDATSLRPGCRGRDMGDCAPWFSCI